VLATLLFTTIIGKSFDLHSPFYEDVALWPAL